MEAPTSRICTKCLEDKPLEEFYKDKYGKFGHSCKCKVCTNIKNKLWRDSNPEGAKSYQEENGVRSKICSGCQEFKPLDEFHNDKYGKYGKCQKCKICISIINKQRYEKNSEEVKARSRKYNRENKGKIKALNHKKYMKRQEEIIENNKRWAQNNQGKVRGYKRSHQFRLETLKKDKDLNPDYDNILKRDGFICYLCGEGITDSKFHTDHIISPLKGGWHAEFNLAITHPRCNISKQDKLPKDLPTDIANRIIEKLKDLTKIYKEVPEDHLRYLKDIKNDLESS